MTDHRPLVVTARLSTPISCERPIPLEGILYDVRFRDDPSTMGSPLDSLSYDGAIPLASAGMLVVDGMGGADFGSEPVVKSVNLRSRSADSLAVPERGRRGMTQIGNMSPYRNSIRAYPTMSGVSSVTWLAVGDRVAVQRAVDRVPGVGALRNRGFGEVSEWSVEESQFASDLTWFRSDAVMRRLPLDLVRERFGGLPRGAVLGRMRVEPPLWVRAGTIEVAFPSLKSLTMSAAEVAQLYQGESAG